MDWMEITLDRRIHPLAMWPQARSAVVLGMNYGPDADPRALQAQASRGALSVYAHGDDYHELIKGRLKQLAGWMRARLKCEAKVFVDTAPLMEKPLAQAGGLGWQGKHTNLVSREFGAWLFLGVVLTTLELPADVPAMETCGSCRACLDACPTKAFPAPFQIDARRCISYLTIEHEGPVPLEFRSALGNRIYGCDDCLAACPWNKFAQAGAGDRTQGAPGVAGSDPCPISPRWTRPPFAPCSASRRSSASGATGWCATCSTPWGIPPIRRWRRRRAPGSKTPRPSYATPQPGRWSGWRGERRRGPLTVSALGGPIARRAGRPTRNRAPRSPR